jgi:hypothetical protein
VRAVWSRAGTIEDALKPFSGEAYRRARSQTTTVGSGCRNKNCMVINSSRWPSDTVKDTPLSPPSIIQLLIVGTRSARTRAAAELQNCALETHHHS